VTSLCPKWAAARQLPIRVNIRLSSIRRRPRPGLSDVAQPSMKLCGQLGEVGSPEDPFVLRATAGRRRKGPFDSSPLRSGGSRSFKSDPSRQGRSIGCLRSRGRIRSRTEGSIVSGTELSLTPFPTTSWWATLKCPSGTDFLQLPNDLCNRDCDLLS
jgi:hypothetical protein